MRAVLAFGVLGVVLAAACGNQGSLGGSDSDGLQGGNFAFDVTVNDTAFSPTILKAQNLANITITFTNAGTRPHDLVLGCTNGVCFPDDAGVGPVEPDASATTHFKSAAVDAIYPFHSDLPGDTQTGQFVVQ